MSYAIFHPRRGVYIEHAASERTGKVVPRFTWRRAKTKGRRFAFSAEAKKFLDDEKKKPDSRMEQCFVAELK